MRPLLALVAGLFGFALLNASAAHNVGVPSACTPSVNARLAQLITKGARREVDNVMVCGFTAQASRSQRAGKHGGHEILSVRVELPGLGTRLIQIATNDDLDGVVTAPANSLVFAYGQAYFDASKQFAAGIHDVHCSTHRSADNGWVVVNGKRYPKVACR